MRTESSLLSSITPANIHISSWVAWGCYCAGFVAMLMLAPGAADDIARFGFGGVVLATGVGAFFAAVIYLQRWMRLELQAAHYTAPQRLVTEGPFAYSRNPIYLAFLMPLAAFAWYSPLASALTTIGYVVVMTQYVIRNEEADLESKFGTSYRSYCYSTPRWLRF